MMSRLHEKGGHRHRPSRQTMDSRVSVIIPTFNRPALLEVAVHSVLVQTHPVHEIIIVDDGSDLIHRERIDALAALDLSISIYHLAENRGASTARNFGLSKATGEFALFLDDDDLLHPKLLESNLQCFRKNPDVDIVGCRRRTFYSPSAPDGSNGWATKRELKASLRKTDGVDLTDPSRIEKKTFSEVWRFGRPIHSCLFRKKCLEGFEFPADLKVGEDTFLLMSLAARGYRLKMNPLALAFVRWHGGNFRLHAEFDSEYIRYLRKLQLSGMLDHRSDQFLCHARLFLELAKQKKIECLSHLIFMLRSPDLFIRYFCLFLSVQYKKRRGRNNLHPLAGMEDPAG